MSLLTSACKRFLIANKVDKKDRIEASIVEAFCEFIGIEEVFRMSAKTGMMECVNKSSLHNISSILYTSYQTSTHFEPKM